MRFKVTYVIGGKMKDEIVEARTPQAAERIIENKHSKVGAFILNTVRYTGVRK